MEPLDDLAAALPAPREDEPPDLRRKILAELRDHLHTAIQRELLLIGDAEQAQQNVLSRFGDPARLARKLWYDAMWEKIMSQRMTLAALVLVVLISVGSTGLTWFLVVQAGQVNQALLEQNRAANELMLARLTALGNAPANSGKTMEWNSLKVRLSFEKPGGAPAANCKVELEGRLLDTSVPASLNRTTGPDGVADFGLVRPGQHLINVVTPWGDSIDDRHDYGLLVMEGGQLVTVLPGEPQTVEIICPSKQEEAEIAITVDWPNDLVGQPLWLVCDFVQSPREVAGHAWIRSNDNGPRYVFVDPSGNLTTLDMPGSDNGQEWSGRSPFLFFKDEGSFYADKNLVLRSHVEESRSDADLPGIYRFIEPQTRGYRVPHTGEAIPAHIWLPKAAAISRLKWPAGKYSVSHVAVGLESETGEKSLPDDLLHPLFLGGIAVKRDGGDDKTAVRLLYPDEERASARGRKRRGVKADVPRFEAVAGRLNEWRLSLPQPLVDLLNEPPIKPETEGDEPDVYPAAPPDNPLAPRRARRAKPQAENDTLDDEDHPPSRPEIPRTTPEDDADGPIDEDDAPRPRRKPRAIPVDDAYRNEGTD